MSATPHRKLTYLYTVLEVDDFAIVPLQVELSGSQNLVRRFHAVGQARTNHISTASCEPIFPASQLIHRVSQLGEIAREPRAHEA